MGVDELLTPRDKGDDAIAEKDPQVKARIAAFQDTLKRIKGPARK